MNDATPAQNRTLAASEAESGLPADQGAREALVEQMAEAVGLGLDHEHYVDDRTHEEMTRAVVAKVEPLFLAQVEAAVSVVRAERDEARDQVRGFQSMRWPEEADRLQQQRNEAIREVERWKAGFDHTQRRAESAEAAVSVVRAERDRLTHLLGSHADGHRCTCTLIALANYNVEGGHAHPEEWEQDPWCPTHPDVDSIKHWFGELAENWRNEAERGEDERYGRIIARTLRSCADEVAALLAPSPAEGTGEAACPGCGSTACKWKRLECEREVTR